MPYRVRAGGGGGGGGGTPPTFSVGPDYGERSGNDDTTWIVGVAQNLDKVAVANTVGVQVAQTLSQVAVGNTQEVRVQQTLDKVAVENTKTVGVRGTLAAVAVNFNEKTIGVRQTMSQVAVGNTKTLGVHQSGSVLAAPFFRSVNSLVYQGVTSPGTVDAFIPTDVNVGDLLLLATCQRTVVNSGLPVPPAGWTAILSPASSSATVCGLELWYKFAEAGDAGSTVTLTTAALNYEIITSVYRIEGAKLTQTDFKPQGVGTNNTLSPDIETLSTSPASANNLIMYFTAHYHTTQSTHAALSGHGKAEDQSIDDGVAAFLRATTYYRAKATTGSSAAPVVDCSEAIGTPDYALTIAIEPGVIVIAP